ncbi:MAG: UDP-N-acetylmuramyl-tripeptide synthetase [Parcubacteria group bacterium]|nr:UDP-N-acetylmuramyl-tripeptide synthetase [Parcubacteria group bacterium]
MGTLKRFIKRLLPRSLYRAVLVPYHVGWAFLSAIWYGFPANKLTVIGVTGTKGKSSVTEMITAIFEEAGHVVAVSSTIHFKTGKSTRPNKFKMTLPGRGFIQKLLAEAVRDGATHAVIELTSESALQYRHLFLSLDALVFTNLEKEHIESHGSMEQYFQAKFRLGRALARSPKRPRAIVANEESEYGKRFLALPVERSIPFSLNDAQNLDLRDSQTSFDYEATRIMLPHPGAFSARNALAAIKTAAFFGVPVPVSAKALAKLSTISGRAERIDAGQDFLAVVDYAHTPDSLIALYEAYPNRRKVCVLGNTGGGRDTWKRPEMGRIADEYCDEVILTNEDPYDENPQAIMRAMATGMKRVPTIIMSRRDAIREALSRAKANDVVLITGKGTDPYIMEANGRKTPWSDAQVVTEELGKLGAAAEAPAIIDA